MNRSEFLKKIKFPKLSIGQLIFWVVTVALSVGAFVFAGKFTACWNLTNLPGIAPASCGQSNGLGTFNPEGTAIAPVDLPPTPNVAPVAELPPAWDGASRCRVGPV